MNSISLKIPHNSIHVIRTVCSKNPSLNTMVKMVLAFPSIFILNNTEKCIGCVVELSYSRVEPSIYVFPIQRKDIHAMQKKNENMFFSLFLLRLPNKLELHILCLSKQKDSHSFPKNCFCKQQPNGKMHVVNTTVISL